MKRTTIMLLAALVVSQAPASAEMIRGTITNMDPANNTLRVRREGPAKNIKEDVQVLVKTDTVTKNVASLQELQVGHDVTIDAQTNATSGAIEATSIEVVKV